MLQSSNFFQYDTFPSLKKESKAKLKFPSSLATDSIKYIGSKKKIISYINEIIGEYTDIKTVLDGFSGSCRVSQFLSNNGYSVTANDLASYSKELATCFLLGKETTRIKNIIKELNSIDAPSIDSGSGWYSQNYGGEIYDTKKPFQIHNTKKLDGILEFLQNIKLSKIEKSILITSLILALDKVDSTLGHQSSYLREWSKRSYKTMELVMPKFFNPHNLAHKIEQKNVFEISKKYHDLVYYDPPYGSANDKMPASRVRYQCYYHIWETISRNDKPQVFGKCNRRTDTKDHNNINPFEDFRKTNGRYNSDIAIEKLIKNTNAKYILFSYNTNGRTSIENLKRILNKYLDIKENIKIEYKKNIMASMNSNKNWQNSLENYEILVMGEKIV